MFLTITDAANHVPVFHELLVLPAKIYDSMILGTDNVEVDAVQLLGTAWTAPATAGLPDCNVKQISTDAGAADNLEAACDGGTYNVGGGAVVTASCTASTPALITTAILDHAIADHLTVGTVGNLIASLGGKMTVTGNQLIVYAANNSTELFRFNLTDAATNPTMTDVYTRTVV
jgi:hypothetical protein